MQSCACGIEEFRHNSIKPPLCFHLHEGRKLLLLVSLRGGLRSIGTCKDGQPLLCMTTCMPLSQRSEISLKLYTPAVLEGIELSPALPPGGFCMASYSSCSAAFSSMDMLVQIVLFEAKQMCHLPRQRTVERLFTVCAGNPLFPPLEVPSSISK